MKTTALLPLKGVRVLDLTRILAGPYCSMLLGDLGADIVKVEQPGKGDETRHWGPPFTKTGDQSAYFLAINRNKRSIVIDFKREEGRGILRDLIRESDVLLENFIPGHLTKWGLDYASVSKLNPRLIYTSITGYGPDGPYARRPGYDVIIEGEAGLMSITGEPKGSPVKVGVAITDLTTGLYAHGAIMAALLARHQTGMGQKIDLSLLECQVASLANIGSSYLIGGEEGKRWGTQHASVVPYQAFKTRDGHVIVGAGSDLQFKKLCDALQCPSLAEQDDFRTNQDRVRNRESLDAKLDELFSKKTTDAWLAILKDVGIPFGPVNGIEKTFQHPQVIHRKMIQEVDHPTAGKIRLTGFPVKYSQTPLETRLPPPLLGQHTREILKSLLNYDDTKIDSLIAKGAIQEQKV